MLSGKLTIELLSTFKIVNDQRLPIPSGNEVRSDSEISNWSNCERVHNSSGSDNSQLLFSFIVFKNGNPSISEGIDHVTLLFERSNHTTWLVQFTFSTVIQYRFSIV